MEWFELEDDASVFVDAHRLYQTLKGALEAPGLPNVAQAGFPPSQDGEPLDEQAFNWLCQDEFLSERPTLQGRIDRIRAIRGVRGDLRGEMQKDLRRAQDLREKVKTIDRELASGGRLFKSKEKLWEVRSQRDAMVRTIEQLTVSASRTESEIDKIASLLRSVLDEIHRDPTLQSARWFGQRVTIVTFNGEFLLEYLEEMNPTHFKGRSLAEILEIGHSLA